MADGVYVVGITNSFGAGGYDIFLLKYDTAGNLIWQKTLGGNKDDLGYGIRISNDYIYIAGATKSYGLGDYDAMVCGTDLSGNVKWYDTWGGTSEDIAHDLYVSGNKIFVVGQTSSFGNGGKDVFIVEYD